MGLFDFLKRKKTVLDDFVAGMSEAECLEALPGLARHVMDVVHRFSIQFYREIHSHHSDGFPAVREEFFYLLVFVSGSRLGRLFEGEASGRAAEDLRVLLTAMLAKHDRRFDAEKFWGLYWERETTYSSRVAFSAGGSEEERLLSAFNAHLLSRIHDWDRLVTHHSAGVAMAALADLRSGR